MSDFKLPITCEQFEDRISDYIDNTLSPADRAVMDAHASQCDSCSMALAEVSAIVRDAAVMPLQSPSRDLWAGISERLDTPVVSIANGNTRQIKTRPTVSFRMFAAAAVLLVTVSSGATYLLTRASSATTTAAPSQATQVASNVAAPVAAPAATADNAPASANPATVAPATTTASAAPTNTTDVPQKANGSEGSRLRYAANDRRSVEFVYEREITAMRRIVDERLGDLDSTTVVEIERNLRIIDKAINDSRRALQNDPKSRFLSSQLDRALENKLEVLRRLALL